MVLFSRKKKRLCGFAGNVDMHTKESKLQINVLLVFIHNPILKSKNSLMRESTG